MEHLLLWQLTDRTFLDVLKMYIDCCYNSMMNPWWEYWYTEMSFTVGWPCPLCLPWATITQNLCRQLHTWPTGLKPEKKETLSQKHTPLHSLLHAAGPLSAYTTLMLWERSAVATSMCFGHIKKEQSCWFTVLVLRNNECKHRNAAGGGSRCKDLHCLELWRVWVNSRLRGRRWRLKENMAVQFVWP